MPSHLVEALFQGIWSSLTGGWFYDIHSSLFINTVHMYTWFFLFALPFSFYIIFPSTFATWLTYTTIICTFFLLVKLFNYQLNRMFDKNKIITSEKLVKIPKKKKPKLDKQTSSLSTAAASGGVASSSTSRPAQHHHHHHNQQRLPLIKSIRTMRRSFDEHATFECDSNTNFNLDSSINATTTNSIVKLSKKSSSSSTTTTSSSSSSASRHNTKKRHSNRYSKTRSTQAVATSCASSSLSATTYNKQTEEINLNLNNDNACGGGDTNLDTAALATIPNTSNEDEDGDLLPKLPDDLEDASNRSLFKISEESIAQLNSTNNTINNKRKIESLTSNNNNNNKSNMKLKQNKTKRIITNSVNNLKQSSSVPGMDVSRQKDPQVESASSISSLNLIETRKTTRENRVHAPPPGKPLVYHEAKSDNKLCKPSCHKLRRAQSDITFDLFEKLVRKHRLRTFESDQRSDDEMNVLTHEDQYYEELEHSTNWTTRLYLKYKTDSENLDKKLENKRFAHQQQKVSSKSFHNLMFSSSLLKINESSFSLISTQKQQEKLLPNTKISSNLTALLSLSQQLRYQDLKQFKTTLECVELLSKKRLSTKKSNLNMTNDEIIHIDDLRSRLFAHTASAAKTTSSSSSIRLTKEEKEQYEKQGAIPKKQTSRHRRQQRVNISSSSSSTSSSSSPNRSSLSDSFESDEDDDMLSEKKKKSSELAQLNCTATSTTTNTNNTSLIWSASSFHSPLLRSRNLTASASHAASAAVKLIRRDLLDRLTNRTQQQQQQTPSRDDLGIDLPMTSTSSTRADQSVYESFQQNDYDEIRDEIDLKQQEDNNNNNDDDYYEEIDDNFYAKNSKLNNTNDSLEMLNEFKASSVRPATTSSKKTRILAEDSSLSPYQFNMRRAQLRKPLDNFSNQQQVSTIRPVMLGDKSLPILLKKTPVSTNLSTSTNRNTPKQNRNHYAVGRTYEEIMQIDFDSTTTRRRQDNSSHYRLSNTAAQRSSTSSGNSKRRNLSSGHRRSTASRHSDSGSSTRANSNTLSTNLGRSTTSRGARQDQTRSFKSSRPSNDSSNLDEDTNEQQQHNNNNTSLDEVPTVDLNQIDAIISEKPSQVENNDDEEEEIKKKIYKLELTKSFSLNIPFSHYSLLAMLDKNKSILEIALSVCLSTLVAVCASFILSKQIYDDILMLVFCFIVASCHYSLLKSVQPDSASPIHGFNSLTALSRPVYFCLLCFLVLVLRAWSDQTESLVANIDKFTLYGFSFSDSLLQVTLNTTETFLLFLPVLFTLGLFPQVNTFLICTLEQVDMYLFGGTAMNNLPSAALCLLRSLIASTLLGLVLFSSIYTIPSVISHTAPPPHEFKLNNNKTSSRTPSTLAATQNQFSQSVVFSVFCGLLVLVSYLLSRQSSDLLVYFSLLKQKLIECAHSKSTIKSKKRGNINHKTDEQVSSPLLEETTLTRGENNTESLSMKTLANLSVEDETAKTKQSKQEYLSVAETSSDSCHPSSPPSSFTTSSTSTPCSTSNTSPIFAEQTSNPPKKVSTDIELASAKNEEEVTNLINESIDFNEDPLEKKTKQVMRNRLESDILISLFIFLFVFAIHVSTVFSSLKPVLNEILFSLAILVGALNHYLIPHLRVENPWKLFSQPLFKPDHWAMFEPTALASLRWFEVAHVGLIFVEKNVLNILVILSAVTISSDNILLKFEPIDPNGYLACWVISIVSMKLLRHSFCEPAKQYKIFLLAYLFNKFDSNEEETLLFDLFLISIFLTKLLDLVDKLAFIYVYTAPWQLPWGSAFHAFAQPLSVPHSALLVLQVIVSSLLGTPLMPLMGSAIFLLSYARPVKFWEKNYKTKRLDNSNTRLQSQFEATTADSENLNAIFYEHLTSVLQNSLCGDIMLGRWGQVHFGDFFVMSSDYLNCLVHIIEIGNGFVTFQLRGLEFKGTYCQQRELEAITEDCTENEGCCCCSVGHLKYMLSFNVSFHLRWVAWSVIARKYIVNAYRIVDNDLSLIVNFFSLRRTLIEFYIKSAVYYLIKSPRLVDWLKNENICKELEKFTESYVDYDCFFDSNLDTDYDTQLKGVTLAKFGANFLKWINHCKQQNLERIKRTLKERDPLFRELKNDTANSVLVRLCFALSLVCRRALNTACNGASNTVGHVRKSSFGADLIGSGSGAVGSGLNPTGGNTTNALHSAHLDSDSLASFQHGYYTLFKGDIRIQSAKDEWVFNDMEILKQIVIPAVRMGLRLHQDHFQNDSNDETSLYDNLVKFDRESVISYERDPVWRYAVLNSVQSLLSLRHQFTEYSDQYKVVMLNKNYLSFRLIKLNKECVRSFWAGQQHELIFLRNKNQERGSIQNAKQVLRNIINSSCDQPIGYPIYVSQLTTSYSSTHPQISKIIGPEYRFKNVFSLLVKCFSQLRQNCTNNCSGSSNENNLFRTNDQRTRPNVTYSAARPDSCQINMTQMPVSSATNTLNKSNYAINQVPVKLKTGSPIKVKKQLNTDSNQTSK